MSRYDKILDAAKANGSVEDPVSDEVEAMIKAPDNVPDDVWELIQQNGRVATERLNEILISDRFDRLKPADKAKLIQLAQNRAYGTPVADRSASKKRAGSSDVVMSELSNMVSRAALPEYKRNSVADRANARDAAEDVEFEPLDKTGT